MTWSAVFLKPRPQALAGGVLLTTTSHVPSRIFSSSKTFAYEEEFNIIIQEIISEYQPLSSNKSTPKRTVTHYILSSSDAFILICKQILTIFVGLIVPFKEKIADVQQSKGLNNKLAAAVFRLPIIYIQFARAAGCLWTLTGRFALFKRVCRHWYHFTQSSNTERPTEQQTDKNRWWWNWNSPCSWNNTQNFLVIIEVANNPINTYCISARCPNNYHACGSDLLTEYKSLSLSLVLGIAQICIDL